MSIPASELQYDELPERAARLLDVEDNKDDEVKRRTEEFRWVPPREPDEDGGIEDVHGTQVTHRFVEAPGEGEMLCWHYVEAGEGEPVVLLHGFPESWHAWNHQIPDLARTHRVIAVDLKGYGQSDKRRGDYTHEGVSEQLLALLDTIGLDRFNLVTHDRGTVQADYLAANHPERVLRYARGEQHLYYFNPSLAPQDVMFSHPDTCYPLMRDPHLQVLRSFTRLTAKPVDDAHIVRAIQEWSWPDIWWAVPRYFNSSTFRKDWIDRRTRLIDAWRCPMLIMQAGIDPRQPYEFYEKARDFIPNASEVLVRIIDAGHSFHAEAPQETTAAIRELLAVSVS
jgi:pimeloyl-ACP methyl ester carboxylesterase